MKTQQILQLTDSEYEMMLFNHYFHWCKHWSHNDVDLQCLLTGPRLFNWWLNEYEKANAKFEEDMQGFIGKVGRITAKDYHRECLSEVLSYFSRPLLWQARELKIVKTSIN